MIAARVSAKGQVTLPKRVRQTLAIQPGEQVLFVVEDKTVWLRPLGASSARALAGSLREYTKARRKGGHSGAPRELVKQEVGHAAAEEG